MAKLTRRDSGKPGPRRPNRTGSVSLRPDGAFDVRVTLPGGKRRRRILRPKPGETEVQHRRRAEAAAGELLADAAAGLTVPSGHTSVAGYAAHWLEREKAKSSAGRGLAPSTVSFYEQMFRYYVVPHVGSRPLPDLSIVDVEFMMDSLLTAGRSPRTTQAARNSLGRLLRAAKRDGLIVRIVTDDASRIRRTIGDDETASSKALDPDDIRRLFEVAAGTRWEPLLSILAFLGVRRGEALGLSWRDVDLDAATVQIRRSLSRVSFDDGTRLVLSPTKTRSSRRLLHLEPVVVDVLRSWRAEQARQRLAGGAGWGRKWAEADLVFTSPRGNAVDPDGLRRALDKLGHQAGIGHVHPHQLRHSVASVLIANGHTAPEVASALGHSSPAVTLSVYARSFDRASVRALATVGDALTRRVPETPGRPSSVASASSAGGSREGHAGYL